MVCIADGTSRPSVLRCGVPQGSVAGPAEFICYTEDVQETISPHELRFHLYADDTQLLSRMSLPEIDIYCPVISDCVSSIHQWCASRRLQLNPNKTEMIWFASAANLLQLRDYNSVWCGGYFTFRHCARPWSYFGQQTKYASTYQ